MFSYCHNKFSGPLFAIISFLTFFSLNLQATPGIESGISRALGDQVQAMMNSGVRLTPENLSASARELLNREGMRELTGDELQNIALPILKHLLTSRGALLLLPELSAAALNHMMVTSDSRLTASLNRVAARALSEYYALWFQDDGKKPRDRLVTFILGQPHLASQALGILARSLQPQDLHSEGTLWNLFDIRLILGVINRNPELNFEMTPAQAQNLFHILEQIFLSDQVISGAKVGNPGDMRVAAQEMWIQLHEHLINSGKSAIARQNQERLITMRFIGREGYHLSTAAQMVIQTMESRLASGNGGRWARMASQAVRRLVPLFKAPRGINDNAILQIFDEIEHHLYQQGTRNDVTGFGVAFFNDLSNETITPLQIGNQILNAMISFSYTQIGMPYYERFKTLVMILLQQFWARELGIEELIAAEGLLSGVIKINGAVAIIGPETLEPQELEVIRGRLLRCQAIARSMAKFLEDTARPYARMTAAIALANAFSQTRQLSALQRSVNVEVIDSHLKNQFIAVINEELNAATALEAWDAWDRMRLGSWLMMLGEHSPRALEAYFAGISNRRVGEFTNSSYVHHLPEKLALRITNGEASLSDAQAFVAIAEYVGDDSSSLTSDLRAELQKYFIAMPCNGALGETGPSKVLLAAKDQISRSASQAPSPAPETSAVRKAAPRSRGTK